MAPTDLASVKLGKGHLPTMIPPVVPASPDYRSRYHRTVDGPPKTRTIITPTGWDEATIREYAQYVITRDNQLSDHVEAPQVSCQSFVSD